jgi:hypothetical protein
MKQLLLLSCALLILALPASAQEWQFGGIFPPEGLLADGNGLHGLAVDGEGKIWMQPFGVDPDPEITDRFLYVFNPDGTQAAFSPLNVIVFDGADDFSINTNFPRGLATDHEGNILISQGTFVLKVDHQTGQGIARVDFGTPPTAATVDQEGNVYVGAVLPGNPIVVYDANLNFLENVREESPTFSRDHTVSPDGLTFYETNFETTYAIIHQREDEFAPFDSVGVAFRGMRIESSGFHPITGNLWVSAGNNLNLPNEDEEADRVWHANTWYEFAPSDLTTPLDSLVWNSCIDFTPAGIGTGGGLCLMEGDVAPVDRARPRGFGFSPDGERAYLAGFNAQNVHPGGNAQVFFFGEVSTEPGAENQSFTLTQNYPNPVQNSTTIEFTLDEPAHVTMRVYDLMGRQVLQVVDAPLAAQAHTTTLDVSTLATGTYLYVMELDGQRVASRRMLVVR